MTMRWIIAGLSQRCRNLANGWNQFWFTPADPTTLGAIRICAGLLLLYQHLACLPELFHYIGPSAWIDAQAIAEIRQLGESSGSWYEAFFGQSLWIHVQDPVLIALTYGLFLLALVGFTIGLFTRPLSVLVWAGHISYVQRGYMLCFGMDTVLAFLTLYLMLGPSGAALSVDAARKQRRGAGGATPSWSANLAIRMIQVHIGIVYLCAGLAKLQGSRWWDGTAVWLSLMLSEFALFDFGWLAHGGDLFCLTLSNVGVAVTLFLEIGFAFLVWNRSWRPVMLGLAVVLHAGIGIFMGMAAFGLVMLTGCLAFVEPVSIRKVIDAARRVPRSELAQASAPRRPSLAA
ncbi:MAG: HTTM domain-containing protein [Gemmataceae bacterium]